MWETTKKDALVAGTKINCPTGAGPASQALGSVAGQPSGRHPWVFHLRAEGPEAGVCPVMVVPGQASGS